MYAEEGKCFFHQFIALPSLKRLQPFFIYWSRGIQQKLQTDSFLVSREDERDRLIMGIEQDKKGLIDNWLPLRIRFFDGIPLQAARLGNETLCSTPHQSFP